MNALEMRLGMLTSVLWMCASSAICGTFNPIYEFTCTIWFTCLGLHFSYTSLVTFTTFSFFWKIYILLT
jgi:hypothetical protein